MKRLYAFCLFWLLVLAFACEEEPLSQTCVVAEPTQKLEWLQKRVQELQKSDYCQFVQTGIWNGNTVFMLGNCAPGINSIDPVYDCDGNLLCYSGDETCLNFLSEVKGLKVIWTNGK